MLLHLVLGSVGTRQDVWYNAGLLNDNGVGSGFVLLSVSLLAALVLGCGTCPEGKFKCFAAPCF